MKNILGKYRYIPNYRLSRAEPALSWSHIGAKDDNIHMYIINLPNLILICHRAFNPWAPRPVYLLIQFHCLDLIGNLREVLLHLFGALLKFEALFGGDLFER